MSNRQFAPQDRKPWGSAFRVADAQVAPPSRAPSQSSPGSIAPLPQLIETVPPVPVDVVPPVVDRDPPAPGPAPNPPPIPVLPPVAPPVPVDAPVPLPKPPVPGHTPLKHVPLSGVPTPIVVSSDDPQAIATRASEDKTTARLRMKLGTCLSPGGVYARQRNPRTNLPKLTPDFDREADKSRRSSSRRARSVSIKGVTFYTQRTPTLQGATDRHGRPNRTATDRRLRAA